MTTFNNPFDSFQVFYYSGPGSFSAVIQVYNGGVFAGRMVFYPGPPNPTPNPVNVPPNGTINPLGTDVPSINYPLTSFQDIWGILRHTRPLYLFLDTGSGVGFLATSGFEPIGGP